MSDVYRLFGLENSPYSVKVRSYLRSKGIPHEWIVRSGAAMEEFRRHAKLPLVPLLVGPDGEALQDSTPILETLERRFPQPALAPQSPGLAFLSVRPGMCTVLQAIREAVSPRTVVRYAQGCEFSGQSREGFAEAVAIARQSEAVILVLGGKSGLTAECTSGELRDRASLGLPGVQEELAQAIYAANPRTVLVLVDGRPPAIPALAERLPAILHAWLPGQEGGPAIADVLFGISNPGGRLPVSVPRSSTQVPLYYGHKPSAGQSYNFIDYGIAKLF